MCLCICNKMPARCLSSLHTGLVFIKDAPQENGPSLQLAGHNVSISFFWRIPTFSPSDAFYCLWQVQRFFPFIIVRLGRNSCKKLSSSVSQLLLSLFWKKHKEWSGEVWGESVLSAPRRTNYFGLQSWEGGAEQATLSSLQSRWVSPLIATGSTGNILTLHTDCADCSALLRTAAGSLHDTFVISNSDSGLSTEIDQSY